MALITIIAKGNPNIEWNKLYLDVAAINTDSDIEIFPIPRESGFDNDAIGITVPSNYENKVALFDSLDTLIKILCKSNLAVTDLYSGNEITTNNFREVLEFL
jgi:hypothetical protein